MGTRTNHEKTKTINRCRCGQAYNPNCDWQQGQCPKHPSLLNQIKHIFRKVKNEKIMG